jgi:hypothetical protein
MRKLQIGILLGILLASFQAASAQEVAYANESAPGYVIFFSNGPLTCRALRVRRSRWPLPMLTGLPD